jgi:DNA-binding transcriptional ArsR family regulator
VDLSAAVALFRSLGDATRLSIVHELAGGPGRPGHHRRVRLVVD